ncbi:hypothetical protein AC579_4404 [Pseudocercospora musae]|uniref:Uncharacterized protein n=1 Tax=Pseudocercospora musae TaxID=113226 RepID=A0A139I6U9_9PEZI|nr:hypothetical protein AC579_4404 [Pseudocercospora musae]
MRSLTSPRSRALFALLQCITQSLAQYTYGDNYLTTVKDSDVVASAFPDVEGIDLVAPAFANLETAPAGWANGTEGPTDLYELDYFIRSIASRNDWISYQAADLLLEEGKSIPCLFLSSSPAYRSNSTKLQVYI